MFYSQTNVAIYRYLVYLFIFATFLFFLSVFITFFSYFEIHTKIFFVCEFRYHTQFEVS